MAKKATAKPKIEKSIETQLWESANKLRGNIEASEYKHVVLSLIFLKYAGVRFERQYNKLKEQYGDMAETICNMPMSYAKDNVFYLPEECRWSYIMENAKQPNIPQIIDKALSDIEKSNKQLTGAMPVNYYSQVGIDPAKLGSLIDTINDMEQHMDDSNDFFGRVYEYCLSNFALQEGKGKGEYYTPKAIVNLITEMIEPYKGKVYDPACGSGGMFVQSSKFIEAHGGNRRDISVYGQEYTLTTYKLAKMNSPSAASLPTSVRRRQAPSRTINTKPRSSTSSWLIHLSIRRTGANPASCLTTHVGLASRHHQPAMPTTLGFSISSANSLPTALQASCLPMVL